MRPFLFALALLAAPAAGDPARLAEEAARELEAAASALSGDGDRVAALTLALEAYQSGQATLREALRQVEAERSQVEARLAEGDAALSQSAALLVRLQMRPRESLSLHPDGPLAALRAGRLASAVVEETGQRTARLAATQSELADVTALREALLAKFERATSDIRDTRRALLAESSGRAPEVPATDVAILTALLEASDSLDALAIAFIDTPAPAPDLTGLDLPVPGEVTPANRGIEVASPPGAVVRAPAPATVRYAGPSPGAPGETALLIEPAPGHLVILAGRADSLVGPGQIVAEGEPIALMRLSVAPESASDDPNVNKSETGSGQPAPERLYIEWQEGGAPVDISGRFRLP